MISSFYNYEQLTTFLLENGANINDINSKGQTALMCACRKSNFDIVQLLISKGANIFIEDNKNKTALHWAVQGGDIKIVEYLFLKGFIFQIYMDI